MVFALFLLLSVSASVDASYFNVPYDSGSYYGYGSYNPYTYDSSSFYGFDNHREDNSFYGGWDYNSNEDIFSEFQNQGYNSNNYFGQGYGNYQYGDFSQLGNVQVSDGVSGTKGPCQTRTLHGNYDGKENDFMITERVCDNVKFDFFKDNSYNNQVNNNLGYDYFNGGVNLNYGNSYGDSGFDRNYNSKSSSFDAGFGSHVSESTSFGKGSKVIFY